MLKLLTSGHSVKCITQLRDEGLHHGLLPLLDVILEQPMGEKFVMLALANTDERVRAARAFRPASSSPPCSGTKYWPTGKSSRPRAKPRFRRSIRRWTRCSTCRAKNSPSPGASPATSRISGRCSRASSSAPASAPTRLLEQPRFRAGYDFLLLRAQAGEIDSELADWWTASRMPMAKRAEMLMPEQAGDKKRRRRRKKPANSDVDRQQRMNTAYVALGANLGRPGGHRACRFCGAGQPAEAASFAPRRSTARHRSASPNSRNSSTPWRCWKPPWHRKHCSKHCLIEQRFGRLRAETTTARARWISTCCSTTTLNSQPAPDPAAPAPAPARLRPAAAG
jgi:hypothetical protein